MTTAYSDTFGRSRGGHCSRLSLYCPCLPLLPGSCLVMFCIPIFMALYKSYFPKPGLQQIRIPQIHKCQFTAHIRSCRCQPDEARAKKEGFPFVPVETKSAAVSNRARRVSGTEVSVYSGMVKGKTPPTVTLIW